MLCWACARIVKESKMQDKIRFLTKMKNSIFENIKEGDSHPCDSTCLDNSESHKKVPINLFGHGK